MKKQLLSIFAALTVSTAIAQVPSVDWATNQDAIYPTTPAATFPGVKFMDAVDANVVWVVGKDYSAAGNSRNYNWYSRSINGGATFAGGNIYSDTNTYVIANMEGIDANTAWVCSYMKGVQGMGAIHRTTNGGTNWVNMTAVGMFTHTTESFANFVTFLTPSVGIANGDPVNGVYELWRTTDGGLSWTQTPSSAIPAPLAGEFAIVNLYAKVGSSNLWFGTNGNRIFRTTDAGLTYSASSVGAVTTSTVTEIAFSSPLNGICYMIDAAFNLQLWNTIDGGATWTQITPLPANLGFSDICQIPGTGYLASFGLGGGNEIVSYSSDNGLTWTDWGSTGIPYVTGDFVDGTTGWAGSLDFTDASSNSFTDIWKYTGTAISGTVSPVAAFSLPSTMCFSGASINTTPVNTSTGSPAMSFSWTVSGAATLSSPTANAPTITFPAAGTYTVALTATNTVGSNTSQWVVNVIACTAPTASFTALSSACTNYSFTATNSSAGTPNPSYYWSISPSTNVTLTPSAIAKDASFRIANAGVYTISLVTSNASGTAQTTQTISVTPCVPLTSFGMDYDCVNTFTLLQQTTNPPGATGAISYTWSVGPAGSYTLTPNNVNYPNPKVVVSANAASVTVTLKARNASGTSTVVSKVITRDMFTCVGIEENNILAQNLSVYPNPAHDLLNVGLPASTGSYQVKLTNILGSVVHEEKLNSNTKENATINLSGKAKGVYFLTVESNTEKVTRKIVIE